MKESNEIKKIPLEHLEKDVFTDSENMELNAEQLQQKIDKEIKQIEEYSEQIADIPDRQEKQIESLGGDTTVVEEKLKPEFNLLKSIRDNVGGRFAKVAAILGIMSLSENVVGGEKGKKVTEQEKIQETLQDVLSPVEVIGLKEKESKVRKPILLQKEYKKEFDWMNDLMKSPEYIKKATENEGLSVGEINKRFRNINESKYQIVTQESIDAANAKENLPGEVKGYYDGEVTYLTNDKEMKKEAIGVHELDHQSTNANENLSDTAIAFYRKAFQDPNNLTTQSKDYYEMAVKSVVRDKKRIEKLSNSHFSNKDFKKKVKSVLSDFDNLPDSTIFFQDYETKYLSEPTELAARKRQLDYFLEESSIKKYGEIFTKKHYNILIELGKKGKLPFGIVQLLVSIKPEFFEEMMNTLANNSNEINNQENHIQNFAQAVDNGLINDQTASYFEEAQPETAKIIREVIKKSKGNSEENNI